jgi:hypothetical protein
VRPPRAPRAAAASLCEAGERGGISDRPAAPPDPRLALALGDEDVPSKESLLCCAVTLQMHLSSNFFADIRF